MGFETLEAETGDQAYEMLTQDIKVDLVFSDLVMPGTLNGYNLASKITAEFPKLKILLTSGYASDVLTGAMVNALTYDILHKPYRQSELAARLHALLAGTDEA